MACNGVFQQETTTIIRDVFILLLLLLFAEHINKTKVLQTFSNILLVFFLSLHSLHCSYSFGHAENQPKWQCNINQSVENLLLTHFISHGLCKSLFECRQSELMVYAHGNFLTLKINEVCFINKLSKLRPNRKVGCKSWIESNWFDFDLWKYDGKINSSCSFHMLN